MAGLAREAYVATGFMKLMEPWVEELQQIYDRVEELADAAGELDAVAVTHKLEEALGPLGSALEAAQQYRDGRLEPRG